MGENGSSPLLSKVKTLYAIELFLAECWHSTFCRKSTVVSCFFETAISAVKSVAEGARVPRSELKIRALRVCPAVCSFRRRTPCRLPRRRLFIQSNSNWMAMKWARFVWKVGSVARCLCPGLLLFLGTVAHTCAQDEGVLRREWVAKLESIVVTLVSFAR